MLSAARAAGGIFARSSTDRVLEVQGLALAVRARAVRRRVLRGRQVDVGAVERATDDVEVGLLAAGVRRPVPVCSSLPAKAGSSWIASTSMFSRAVP
jgi:hypothetical protein